MLPNNKGSGSIDSTPPILMTQRVLVTIYIYIYIYIEYCRAGGDMVTQKIHPLQAVAGDRYIVLELKEHPGMVGLGIRLEKGLGVRIS